ncbi:MAG: SDR family oxidoreductase [Deltaproteobacteria bacterium]|nr:SDR family oxidoreductase [Deltaproteobacteria bacterium]
MSAYDDLKVSLKQKPRVWGVTGVAGFIGSHLLEELLKLDQKVVGLDNFATGYQKNLDEVKSLVGEKAWQNFKFIEGDITNPDDCQRFAKEAEVVLHQGALGSVPRSIENPYETNRVNVSGTLNVFDACRNNNIKRVVYASSSSIYGDHPGLPKKEDLLGKPLSPYAVSKLVNEIYAEVYALNYGLETTGLRYFNVFGPRQDPTGAYAAVIPIWASSFIKGQDIFINGTGETSRDFCYVKNVVQANLLAATTTDQAAINQAYNVALNNRVSLTELFELIKKALLPNFPELKNKSPEYREFRAGDIMHSQADISKIQSLLRYEPTHTVSEGLAEAISWYSQNVV